MAPSSAPDPHLLGDFMVSGEHTLAELAEIYGVKVDDEQAKLTLSDYFDIHLDHAPKKAPSSCSTLSSLSPATSARRVNVVGLRLPGRRRRGAAIDAPAEGQAQTRRNLVAGGGGCDSPFPGLALRAPGMTKGHASSVNRRQGHLIDGPPCRPRLAAGLQNLEPFQPCGSSSMRARWRSGWHLDALVGRALEFEVL
jgi:hypothetical protein